MYCKCISTPICMNTHIFPNNIKYQCMSRFTPQQFNIPTAQQLISIGLVCTDNAYSDLQSSLLQKIRCVFQHSSIIRRLANQAIVYTISPD